MAIKKTVNELRKEFLDKLYTLVIAAFGFVAALSWNEAVLAIFKKYYSDNGEITAKLIYAIIVTAVMVFITISISRLKVKNGQ